ncbi:MAG: DUF3791 domain-containing protein [Planctomycetaceae bacterium]|jgi:hypothetical protein|nr:DUF3791 domain-containing protein [Planctomycetaceae bacterium]
MHSNKIDFLIYCIEIYKSCKKMSGKEVITLFDRFCVTNFILDCYDVLHTEGEKTITWEIDDFLTHHLNPIS